MFIALLRGINVSGQKKIKMADLRIMLEAMDFSNVQTYIQSGNIVFNSTISDTKALAAHIKSKIAETFGYEVKVMVLAANEFKQKVESQPFTAEEALYTYFTFLSEKPQAIPEDKIEAAKKPEEKIHIQDDMVYFMCKENYGRSKLSNNFFEQKLKVDATTRNWKTCQKLIEMAG